MKVIFYVAVIALTIALAVNMGNAQQPSTQPVVRGMQNAPGVTASQDDDIQAALAKLNPEDRKLAEAQKFCAVQTKNRLGVMGTPVKVMIKDQPVLLCCKGCVAKAQANPDKTLATLADLLKANKKD
jgi:hypothetical protein